MPARRACSRQLQRLAPSEASVLMIVECDGYPQGAGRRYIRENSRRQGPYRRHRLRKPLQRAPGGGEELFRHEAGAFTPGPDRPVRLGRSGPTAARFFLDGVRRGHAAVPISQVKVVALSCRRSRLCAARLRARRFRWMCASSRPRMWSWELGAAVEARQFRRDILPAQRCIGTSAAAA